MGGPIKVSERRLSVVSSLCGTCTLIELVAVLSSVMRSSRPLDTKRYLGDNALTTLPDSILHGLPNLLYL